MGLKRLSLPVVFLAAGLAVVGCAHGLKPEARAQVDFQGMVQDVQQSPGAYEGRVVRWGGTIIETQVLAGGTDVVVLQHPLEFGDRPKPGDAYWGRFMVRTQDFRDPAVFQRGALISVVGRLVGTEMDRIGELDYAYPILEPMDVKVWKSEDLYRSPAFHFGFGLGGRF